MTDIDVLAVIPPVVGTGTPIEADWGNAVIAALAEHEYKINSILPPGTIWQWAGPTAPPGWALCDGSTHATNEPNYADLFAIIGYTYGGSGANFLLPDLQGRVPVGLWAGNPATTPLGKKSGVYDQALITHAHDMKGHVHYLQNHVHGITVGGEGGHKHLIPSQNIAVVGNVWGTAGNPLDWPRETGTGVLFGEAVMVADTSSSVNSAFSSSPANWFAQPISINYPQTWTYSPDEIGAYSHTHPAWSGGPSAANSGGPNDNTTGQAGTAPSGVGANLPPYTVLNYIIRLGFP